MLHIFGVSSYFLTYDNQYERHADLVAVQTLKHAGYDPATLTSRQRRSTAQVSTDPIHAIHARLLVQLTLARSLAGDLALDLQGLLQRYAVSNADVRWTPAFQRVQIAGQKGLRTTVNAVSPKTGKFEEVSVAATRLPDGNVLYVIGVAPQEESGVYRGVFNRIVESVQIAR